MGLMNNIKSMISSGNKNQMNILDIINDEYKEFNKSDLRQWMITGDNYYKGDNDIKSDSSDFGVNTIHNGMANNKLAHAQMKLLVDEKVNYLFSKPYSLISEDKNFKEALRGILGKKFRYTLNQLGYEAANKGIGWLHPYISKGKLKFMVVPAEQCCPIWTDNSHTELEAMIRYYTKVEYEGKKVKNIIKLEYWTEEGVQFFEVRNDKVIRDINAYIQRGYEEAENEIIPHYTKDGQPQSWGKTPYIAFKNNMQEFPDIRYIKRLVDNYDMSRSEVANFIQDVKNLIYVLKGYGGEDLGTFMDNLRKYRAIKIEDVADGDVDTINPTMDITAAETHYTQLQEDIEKFAQAIPKNIEKLGNNPSGTALRFHYAAIDLKCNALESEFKFGFEELLYFIKVFLLESNQGNYANAECDIQFNRDVAINTTAEIANCKTSKELGLSLESVLEKHPWIEDISKELERIEKERQVLGDDKEENNE